MCKGCVGVFVAVSDNTRGVKDFVLEWGLKWGMGS